MKKLTLSDLLSLEEYHKQRPEFRARVLAHKKDRQVSIGPNATLYFEDRLTMQYQVQEMLRVERIFEEDAIEDELAAYNPLIPDGKNLKATFMLEFVDAAERRHVLVGLAGIEDRLYLQVAGFDRVFAVADEDMERSQPDKTSAVHFVRFELTDGMIAAVKSGAELRFGIDHDEYRHETAASDRQRAALLADFD
jgi:hypothetical protein